MSSSPSHTDDALLRLPLDSLHRGLGAKFAPFADYDMPVQYEGLIAEHNWTRAHAGLFDVSHMGPCFLALPQGEQADGDTAHARLAALIERLVPADIAGLKPGQVRYTMLLNDRGGVLDDLMIARPPAQGHHYALYLVVNAGCKKDDWALIEKTIGDEARLIRADKHALLALQGPSAAAVTAEVIGPAAAEMKFMAVNRLNHERFGLIAMTRSGYTGEDGYEILIGEDRAPSLAEALLAHGEVKPVGLGARDTLRLEAGLCLYGHELGETISPIEADLAWTIQKRRRATGDFPGATRILSELAKGPTIKRVGIRPADRAPARDNTEIQVKGHKIGVVTSGGFSPSLNVPISMGYVEAPYAAPGTKIDLIVRGQARPAEIVALPFVPHNYFKG